jgi:hypothetical protein
MANKILKITNSSYILSQNNQIKLPNNSICKREKLKYNLKRYYHNLNVWFGIEGSIKDQLFYYGVYGISIMLLLITFVVSGILYGF